MMIGNLPPRGYLFVDNLETFKICPVGATQKDIGVKGGHLCFR